MALESTPDQPQPLRRVAQGVDQWINRLGWIWVEAQVIEINRRSGNTLVFLTLRDKLGEVSASVTTTVQVLDTVGPLSDGATVVAHLKPRFFIRSGRFSFHCDELRVVGEGMLLARLEQLKRMLQAEGLFDPRLKRRLPFLPSAIGLVSAAGSAAERDVVDNVARRWPAARIVTAHSLVQGPQAVEQLVSAVGRLDQDPDVEVIVIARGGGSLEDLLAFSNEALVRAVAACSTPVVSAIGHEVDSPILDLVADVRASTPTDAAKIVVPDVTEERARLDQVVHRLDQAIHHRIRRERDQLATLASRPVLQAPTETVTIHRGQVDQLAERLGRSITRTVAAEQTSIDHLLARCRALSPRATLLRGYTLALDADGHPVTSADRVSIGDPINLHLAEGRVETTVTAAHPARPATDTAEDPS
ncbi:MAG TPA: exodeoxyribonuclease VII large subunit [Candidatus Avipropionibacterium avicola]|uniref:Exodeoxyribonuclease 7 large subunit n=1 Tax=Candidatus Avipropionibacterium avicola TaxID=2840701 RepID=A0A9D1GV92_9ACTN|nr:exodeoxyribonuclease VII large subunit [Candidatus Avipropionibacterium avicola]